MDILELALLGSLRIAFFGALKIALFAYTLFLSDTAFGSVALEDNLTPQALIPSNRRSKS
jgi:ABC-type transport system involved in cytochrome bd biosynthesis fused ATPase/permease subunit